MDNLICLCANCHARADKEKWGPKVLHAYKARPWILRKGETKLSKTKQVRIVIDKEFDKFDKFEEGLFRHALSSFLEIPQDSVRILLKDEGSVRILVELPEEDAQRLTIAFKERSPDLLKALGRFPITRIAPVTWRPGFQGRQYIGFNSQRSHFQDVIVRREPTIVVIHGEANSGHSYLMDSFEVQIETAGIALWRPISSLHWFRSGEPTLERIQQSSAIAASLSLEASGTSQNLEERIAQEIARRCQGGQALIFRYNNSITVPSAAEADALAMLIGELWPDLIQRALRHQSKLPVFLLLPIVHPTPNIMGQVVQAVSGRAPYSARLIHAFEAQDSQTETRLVVLPELEHISQKEVEDFLTGMGISDASSIASEIVNSEDNDRILSRFRQYLENLETL